MLETLPQRLRLARIELQLTQAQAAEAIGITQPMLHRAETSLEVSSNRLLQILDHYINVKQINPSWLLCEPNTGLAIISPPDANKQKLRLLDDFRSQLEEIDNTTD